MIGTQDIIDYVGKFEHLKLTDYFQENLLNFKKKPWAKFVNKDNEDLVDETAFDLLTSMLMIDHTERITAKEALKHPYFNSIKH